MSDYNKKSFCALASEYHISIPLIQREYAQGRGDKQGEEVRKNFVPELIKVLTGEKESLELDFVFGVKENKKFIPLDGQQRLTTLLLLHWYCGIHKGNWSFTYESRRMANSFVNGLLTEEKKYDKSSEPSVWIKSRDWFFENWLADPTVSGMLTMLDEIHKNAKNKDCKPDNLNNITFYLYPIKELDADNAYTKMNARGEPLTEWENIKALLDKKAHDFCYRSNPWETEYTQCALSKWVKNIDVDWLFKLEKYADLAPENLADDVSLESAIKKINCAFRNIFDLAVCVDLAKQINEPPSNENKNNEKISSIQNQISSFHEHKTLLSDYAECVNRRIFDIATDLFQTLLLFDSSDLKKWWDENLCIWESKERKSFTDAFLFNEKYSFVDCVRFYSICRFGNELTGDWLRIIRNILENGPEIGKNNFADAISLIEELSGHPEGILTFLAAKENDIQSTFATEQVKEEREKARQIIEPPRDCKWNCCGPDRWEIQEAEKTAFFKGAIRFLYHDENGEVNWSQFKQKFENAKQYFDENGVAEDYRENAKLLRVFLAKVAKVEKIDFWFGNGKEFWRNHVLLKEKYSRVVHALFTYKDWRNVVVESDENWIEDNTLIADAITGDNNNTWEQWCIQYDWRGCSKTLTRYSRRESGSLNYPKQVIPLSDVRKKLLKEDKGVTFVENLKRGSNYFIGWETEFYYKGNTFTFVEGNPCKVIFKNNSFEFDKSIPWEDFENKLNIFVRSIIKQ